MKRALTDTLKFVAGAFLLLRGAWAIYGYGQTGKIAYDGYRIRVVGEAALLLFSAYILVGLSLTDM